MNDRLLLDSHILLWWFEESRELGIKSAIGKLKFPSDLQEQLRASSFTELPISISHAMAAAKLPRHHADPFDRMLVAQASVEGLTLLTSDRQLASYKVKVMLA